MKIVEYTLNPDGTIPSSVRDGGYFAVANDLESPQDWVFMGLADDETPFVAFESHEDLTAKLAEVSGDWLYHSHSEDKPEPFDPVKAAAFLWGKLA